MFLRELLPRHVRLKPKVPRSTRENLHHKTHAASRSGPRVNGALLDRQVLIRHDAGHIDLQNGPKAVALGTCAMRGVKGEAPWFDHGDIEFGVPWADEGLAESGFWLGFGFGDVDDDDCSSSFLPRQFN